MLNNGTLCMFEAARRSLSEPKPTAIDRLQLCQFGMARRLLNPQLYELHDDDPDLAADNLTNPSQMDTNQDPVVGDAVDGSAGARSSSVCASKLYDDNLRPDRVESMDVQTAPSRGSPAWHKNVDSLSMRNERGFDDEHREKCDTKIEDKACISADNVPSLMSPVTCELATCGAKSESNVIGIIQAVREADRELLDATSGRPTTANDKEARRVPANEVQSHAAQRAASQVTSPLGTAAKCDNKTTAVSGKAEPSQSMQHTTNKSPLPCRMQTLSAAKNLSSTPPSVEPCKSVRPDSLPAHNVTSCKHSGTVSSQSVTNGTTTIKSEATSQSKCTALPNSSSSHCKDTPLPSTQCIAGKHPDLLLGTCAESTGCVADSGSRNGSQKDGGKFCECINCEIYGHMLVSVLFMFFLIYLLASCTRTVHCV
jgi:hypothetical protein